MKSLIHTFIKNPVLVHMITIGVIVFGTFSFLSMPRELSPNLNFYWMTVEVWYPGVSPEEIEKLVTKPIEDEISDVKNIKTLTSSSAEGRSIISIQFEQDINEREFKQSAQSLRTEIEKVSLPDDAEDPSITELDSSDLESMLDVVVSGDLPELKLKQIAEDLQEMIREIEHVADVSMWGDRQRQIRVAVDPSRLNQYGLAIAEIANAISAQNLNMPAGKLKVAQSELLLRTIGEFEVADQIYDVIIRKLPTGGQVRVRDVATVQDGYEDWQIITRLNGKTSVSLSVAKQSRGNTIKIVDQVKTIIDNYRKYRLPKSASITLVSDSSTFVKSFIQILQTNAFLGIVFVVVALFIFIGFRNALFVAAGIPIALLMTFTIMYLNGQSINQSSLFALVLVLGIVVDDAIVVIENIYRRLEKGEPLLTASVEGAKEVAVPILAASLTSIAAFLPLALLPGLIGRFMRVIPIVVSLTIVASLLECFLILPSHVAEWGKAVHSPARDRLMSQLLNPYSKLLRWVLRWRYLVLSLVVLVIAGSIVLVASGLIPVDLFAADEMPMFFVGVTLPSGTNLEETDRVIRQFEQQSLSLPKSEVNAVLARTGYINKNNERTIIGSNTGMLVLDLVEAKQRQRSVEEVIDDLRAQCQQIAGPESVEYIKNDSGPPAATDVEVLIKGRYFDQLEGLSNEIQDLLSSTDGVFDVQDDYQLGKEELKLKIRTEKAQEYGLNVNRIAQTIRSAFDGFKATVIRDGDEEIDVVVKYIEDERQSIQNLQEMNLLSRPNMFGSPVIVPLKDVSDMSRQRGYATIERFQRERAVTIRANLDKKKFQRRWVESLVRLIKQTIGGDLEAFNLLVEHTRLSSPAAQVNEKIQSFFDQATIRYPACNISFEGELAEINSAFSDVGKLFAVGMLLIYFILGTQFKSFVQPIIIMMAVPFAFVGAVLGLINTGNPLSLSSLFGIVALAGIVVNDAIVLIDFINRQRQNGAGKWRALIKGGRIRLRPIILTSVTTIFGLLPMSLGIGGRSATWMPMASTIVWGLAVATLMTLFVVPAFYAVIDDLFPWKNREED